MRTRLTGSAPPEPRPPAVSRAAGGAAAVATPPEATRVRSYPWWQAVATLRGSGSATTEEFTIDDGALQWRVRWRCETGRLVVATPHDTEPVIDADCPEGEPGYSIRTGSARLQVTAEGPWQLEVEQQVDVPLVEPPAPEMTAAGTATVATGSFFDMEQTGRGTVTVYRLAGGGHALRLEEFFVTPNVDLEIHLSPLEAPKTTEEFRSAPSEKVARLDVTAGSMNFDVPDGIDPSRYRSVVIWCPPLHLAYAAATLEVGG